MPASTFDATSALQSAYKSVVGGKAGLTQYDVAVTTVAVARRRRALLASSSVTLDTTVTGFSSAADAAAFQSVATGGQLATSLQVRAAPCPRSLWGLHVLCDSTGH